MGWCDLVQAFRFAKFDWEDGESGKRWKGKQLSICITKKECKSLPPSRTKCIHPHSSSSDDDYSKCRTKDRNTAIFCPLPWPYAPNATQIIWVEFVGELANIPLLYSGDIWDYRIRKLGGVNKYMSGISCSSLNQASRSLFSQSIITPRLSRAICSGGA